MKRNPFAATIIVSILTLAGSAPVLAQHRHYKFIDLGTFGRPASYFANTHDGILNNAGTAVGWADTSAADAFPIFCFNIDCFVSHAFVSQNGARTDLVVICPQVRRVRRATDSPPWSA